MADFCKYCSIEMFGQDFKEMANITSEESIKENRYAAVLCEGCGPCQVLIDGTCITHKECVEKIEDEELRKKWLEGGDD